MKKFDIQEYYKEIDSIKNDGKTKNEESLRLAFITLLKKYARDKGYTLVPEKKLKGSKKKPDATIFNTVSDPIGYYESKDTGDDLDIEISKKFKIGYPNFNIIFEDTENIVLFQGGKEYRKKIAKADDLHEILVKFISYQSNEVTDYYDAVEYFKRDLKEILIHLRAFLTEQLKVNNLLKQKRKEFLHLCRESINKEIRVDDIDEMIIQHMVTNEIFSSIFDRSHYHQENNIAKQLDDVVKTFFKEEERLKFKTKTDKFYNAIKAKASRITDHHEKQKFLKEVYEQFYKIYNPKLADKLGVVYTPNEVVDFIIKGTDKLLLQYFNKMLAEENVEIIDPATGTGTFICDLIDYIPARDLEKKFENELHANEISILPYYVANLNIEATYHQKMKTYKSFKNIVFVDTLELISHKHTRKDKKEQESLFDFSAENLERIKNQNKRKISVVIGNPPYNANQISENDNNKNKKYERFDALGVDDRIKETYIKKSNAQKTKMYDMYARFFRWATDRIESDGMVSFITNRSFLSKRTFDGFRLTVEKEFQHIYIIDLGGELRGKSENISNIFGITTGVAISFMIKREKDKSDPCQIHYFNLELPTKEKKLQYLSSTEINTIDFIRIKPDAKGNWLNQTDNDFDDLIPIGTKATKALKKEDALFRLYFNGVNSARDEWVFDLDKKTLQSKMEYLTEKYDDSIIKYIADLKEHPRMKDLSKYYTDKIKWSEGLKQYFARNMSPKFDSKKIIPINYRPFTLKYYYSEKVFSDRLTSNHLEVFGNNFELDNKVICITASERLKFSVLATKYLTPFQYYVDPAQCISLYTYEYDSAKKKYSKKYNITDWGLLEFQNHYGDDQITPEDIFYYTYSVLHNPDYIEKYVTDLEKELPKLPYYENFDQWVIWGKDLMKLHIDYEKAKPFNLKETTDSKVKNPKSKLKADKVKNRIVIDEATILSEIPNECWEYFLGNRTAIEWVLDQHKEFKYSEKTGYGKVLNNQFNNYQLSNSKKELIELIKKICTISVETRKIISLMSV